MRPVNCLVLHAWVPPGIKNDHRVGGRQIKPHAACLETNEKYRYCRVCVKRVDDSLTITRLAREILVGDTAFRERLGNDIEHGGELAENEHLPPFSGYFLCEFETRFELC